MAGGRPALDENVGKYSVDMFVVDLGGAEKVYYPKPEDWKKGDLRKAVLFQQVVHRELRAGAMQALAPARASERHPLFKDASGMPLHKLICASEATYKRVLGSCVSCHNAEVGVKLATTEKSFGKNLRTFGIQLNSAERSFTFDLSRWNSLCNRVCRGGVSTQGSSPLIEGIRIERPPSFYLEFGCSATPTSPPSTPLEIKNARGKERWKCIPQVEIPGMQGPRRVSFVLALTAGELNLTTPSIDPRNTSSPATTKKAIKNEPISHSIFTTTHDHTPGNLTTRPKKRAREFCEEDIHYEKKFLEERKRMVMESLRRDEIGRKIFGIFPDDPLEEQQEMSAFIQRNRGYTDSSPEEFLDLSLVERRQADDLLVIKQEKESPFRRDKMARTERDIRRVLRDVDICAVRYPSAVLFHEAEHDLWKKDGYILSAGIAE